MPAVHQELYDILGVSADCDQTEIKKAYRRCAKQCHPDRNPGVDPDLFKKVSHAYEILSDPHKREVYNKYGEEGLHGSGKAGEGQFFEGEDLFGAFFGFSFDGYGDKAENFRDVKKGEDIRHTLSVSLEDLYIGKTVNLSIERTVLIDRNNNKGRKCLECEGKGFVTTSRYIGFGVSQRWKSRCKICGGYGQLFRTKKERKVLQVNIERGMEDKEEIRFEEMADETSPYIKPGDLIVVLEQKPHSYFYRVKGDLYIELSISLAEAIGGFELPIETLDRRILLIRNEPGTIIHPNMQKRIIHEGMPFKASPNERGDLTVQFKVVFPPDHSISEEACARLRVLLPGIPRSSQVQVDADRIVQVAVCKKMNDRQETFANKEQPSFSKKSEKSKREDTFCVVQ
ncbi:DnaJ homolog subfamily A member 2 [Galdieria sulphuraria]|uniref:Molecular chaperone DnaJ n=1 Tax=Galdieria sulphuraria TaxID=130081 RepID=M2X682_GALSU|nr:molecular chaperone DnaJ [Galdieria sulphuraria]EME32015.1 molecular chaperone DnaJ [Galdieria sulphuraria]GJD09882.1 DnaJ homolog subfamily A member 2 [Galdieria sulphuraria]|eukprot:XP_005708535.1 molecular chaperone DnaJ [Galdieria sulphuraria]